MRRRCCVLKLNLRHESSINVPIHEEYSVYLVSLYVPGNRMSHVLKLRRHNSIGVILSSAEAQMLRDISYYYHYYTHIKKYRVTTKHTNHPRYYYHNLVV